METVVQILEAEQLVPIMHIPSEMLHSRLEVTLRPIEETSIVKPPVAVVNHDIMQRFLKAAESGDAKEHLKKKLAEGTKFDFDAAKLINGTMTENDWQNLYTFQKQAWIGATAKKVIADLA